MKATIRILYISLVCCTFHLQGQIISGHISDNETNKPIPNASIRLGKRGVLSDENGSFQLKVLETDLAQNLSLRISHVGHHEKHFNLKSFPDKSTIFLQPQTKELQEVIVTSSARDLVKKSIEAIPQNYLTKEFILSGNFLQTVRRSKNDTVFKIDYRANTLMVYDKNTTKNTEVELVSYKKTNSKTIDSAKYLHWRKDGKIIQYFDFVFNHDDFLDLQKIDKYHYSLQDIREINGRSTYQIKFDLKSKPKQYVGNIYIDEESLAFIAFDFIDSDSKESEDEEIFKEEKSLLYGKTVYKKVGNFWFVDSLEFSKSTKLLGQRGYISIHYKTDSIIQSNPKLRTNFYTRLTSDIVMETLEENTGLPLQIAHKQGNSQIPPSNKKQKLNYSYSIGLQSQFNVPQGYKSYNLWQQELGIETPELITSTLPMFQTGIKLHIHSFQLGILSLFEIPIFNSFSGGYNYEIARPFFFNKKNRPIYIKPGIGLHTLTRNHLLKSFTPTSTFQQKEKLDNEPYKAIFQIYTSNFHIDLNIGIHLTRKKTIEFGVKYNIPTEWSEELYVQKENNHFFQNLLKINTKTITMPFQTVESIQHNLSFNLTFQF